MDIAVKNLMFDSANHIDMYDAELDRNLTKDEVDAKIAQLCYEYTGLTKNSTEKQIKRALESEKAREFFAVIEEILEKKIETGLQENEFFNNYVEEINLADGDKNEFWAQEDIILNIERVSGDHHDLNCIFEYYRIRVA